MTNGTEERLVLESSTRSPYNGVLLNIYITQLRVRTRSWVRQPQGMYSNESHNYVRTRHPNWMF